MPRPFLPFRPCLIQHDHFEHTFALASFPISNADAEGVVSESRVRAVCLVCYVVSFLRRAIFSITSRTNVLPVERWSADYWRARIGHRPGPEKNAPLVMLEGVEDPFFYNIHAQLVVAIGEVRVARWMSNSLNAGAAKSVRSAISGFLNGLFVSRWKWSRLYGAICGHDADGALRWHAPWKELAYWMRAVRIFTSLRSKDHLSALTIDGIRVGDLVIDTYLRFRPTPEVNLRDRYLVAVLRRAIKDVNGCRSYFRKTKPSLYLTTYTTYVQHGVPVRVAVAEGIATWAFGNAQEYGTKLTPDHLVQTRRNRDYCRDFAKLDGREEKIAYAATALGGRLSGVADTVTSYLSSAYQLRTHDVPDVRDAAVVFLHDFYDSPHIYGWLVFHDFWEWTCTTIETLLGAGRPFVVKPHPSQRAESNWDIPRLAAKYPGLRIISSDVSNRQLVDAGMACAITVYGSVAAEMAFMGVPTIACGDNPHASFDGFHIATNEAQYREMISNFQNLARDAGRLREQACAFYYMHNLSDGPEALELRERLFDFIRYMRDLNPPDAFDSDLLVRLLKAIEATSGFDRLVATLRAELGKSIAPVDTFHGGAQQCLLVTRS